MGELEELKKILEDRTRLLEALSQREREIRALNEQQQKVLNERAKLIEDLQRRNRESSVLLAVAQTVTQSLNPQEVVRATLDKLKEFLEIECGFVHLFEEDQLVLQGSYGFVPELERELAVLDHQESLIGQILGSTEPVSVGDIAADPHLPLIPLLKSGYNSYLGLQLKAREEESLGILSLASRFRQAFRPGDIDLLAGIGREMAMALQNCQLYQKVREEKEELEFVTRLERIVVSSLDLSQVYDNFVQELRKYMPLEWGGVVLIEGDKVRLRAVSSLVKPIWQKEMVVPLKGTATEWVARNKRSLVEEDLAEKQMFWTGQRHLEAGVRSIIYLPLLLRGECFGSLILGSEQPRVYGPREIRLLERLAAQLAPLLKNDVLYAELQKTLDREKEEREQLRQIRDELERAVSEMLELVFQLAEVHQPEEKRRLERLTRLCRLIAERLGQPEEEVKSLEMVAKIHDLGRLFAPPEIIRKRGELTPEERQVLRSYRSKFIEALSGSPRLRELVPYIEGHLERYDGSGPQGLKGEEIPLGACILAVADAYVELTSRERAPGLGREPALQELKRGAGTKWHPRVVEALLGVPPEALE